MTMTAREPLAREAADLDPGLSDALDELLLALADDEFVLGFGDSEWTGIAPMLEEDIAMSSIAQDELGHANAFYGLLAEIRGGTTGDAIAYDREPEAYRQCRLVDRGRGDWAHTVARRFLYDTADGVRLAALTGSAWAPLAELVGKIAREERYHQMHAVAWLNRLGERDGTARERLDAAWADLAPDAATTFAPLAGAGVLVDAGVLAAPLDELEASWREQIAPQLERLGLAMPPPMADPDRARLERSDAFRWLWGELTSVRRIDPEATW
jgi:ring-1,2-phenylacetyl-CoA epoxidase subunit PaaC